MSQFLADSRKHQSNHLKMTINAIIPSVTGTKNHGIFLGFSEEKIEPSVELGFIIQQRKHNL